MRVEIERRDADVAGGEARGHLGLGNCAGKDDAGEPGGGLADRRQLRAVADEHRADVVRPRARSSRIAVHEVNRAVPAAKRAGKYRDDLGRSRERHGPGDPGMELLGVRAPLEPRIFAAAWPAEVSPAQA